MTALLTPEQLAGIVKRDKHHSDPVVTSHTDRRALLRDREAICERLEGILTGAWMDSNFHHVVSGESVRALISELRGGE